MAATGKARAPRRRRHGSAATVFVLIALGALLAFGASIAAASPAGAGLTVQPATSGESALPAAGAKPFAETAPTVTKQPTSITVAPGQSASFEATASGSPVPSVQWELSTNNGFTFKPIEGASSNVYTIAATTAAETGWQFRARFKNGAGEVASKAATLTVQKAPTMTLQPTSKQAEEGHPVSFEASAEGAPAPTVQWQSEASGSSTWKSISNATSNVLTISSPKASESGTQFRAIFKNSLGEATSEAATLTVVNAPKVTIQPTDKTVEQGHTATFESAASGTPTPSEQWEVSTNGGETWSVVAGEKGTQLAVFATASEAGYKYRASFTNVAGSATSNVATLTVVSAPSITKQPVETLVLAGQTATFEATASAVPAATVQWEVSSDEGATWKAVPSGTEVKLTLPETQVSQNRNLYRATFTNSAGATTSHSARLYVSANDYEGFGWGLNLHGEAGTGSSETSISSPMPVPGPSFLTAISAGMHHSLALTANGRVYSWGFNSHGQLGIEGIGSRVPVQIPLLKGVTAVAAGGNHSLALLENGTVESWGDDESGQLGDGKNTDNDVPTTISGLTEVTAIAAGDEHSLALLKNGTVMAWGNNERGQLGTGSLSNKSSPQPVSGLTEVAAIAAAGKYSLALLKNGTVMAWGDDETFQLGNKALVEAEEKQESHQESGFYSTSPVQVETLTGVTQIAAGHGHALALLGSGTVMAWGQGAEGELGNGAMELRVNTPVQVSGLANVKEIAAGDQESAALLTGGTVDAWGNNQSGQLGQGTSGTDSDVPLQVLSLSGAAGIAAGGSHMQAFGVSLPVVSSISPNAGGTGGGTSVTISGSDLGAVTEVKFGSVTAPSFTVNSANSITAVSPAGSGTVNVTVVTAGGTSPVVPAARFTYHSPPTVTKLSVKGGPASGGTTITLTGTNFGGTTEVLFGGVPGTEVKVSSEFVLTVTSPPNSSGTAEVRVRGAYGESPASTKARFKYAPVITSFSPPSGPVAGGNTVEITGAGFVPGTTTKFKFGKANSKSVTCASTTTCTALVPAQSKAGAVDVRVTANKGKSAIAPSDQYTYE